MGEEAEGYGKCKVAEAEWEGHRSLLELAAMGAIIRSGGEAGKARGALSCRRAFCLTALPGESSNGKPQSGIPSARLY
jgi:hypothetical protein